MKKSTNRIIFILNSRSGESLTEGMVSLLIAALLFINVSLMITASLRLSGQSILDVTKSRNDYNWLLFEDYDSPLSTEIKLKSDDGSIDITQKIVLNESDEFIVFRPEDTP